MRLGTSIDPNEFTVARATEKLRVDEHGQHRFALSGVEPPHPLDLRGRQPEPGAFEVFSPYVMDDGAGYEGSHKYSDCGSGRKTRSGHLLFVRVKTDTECKACASACWLPGLLAIAQSPPSWSRCARSWANDVAPVSANSSLKSLN